MSVCITLVKAQCSEDIQAQDRSRLQSGWGVNRGKGLRRGQPWPGDERPSRSAWLPLGPSAICAHPPRGWHPRRTAHSISTFSPSLIRASLTLLHYHYHDQQSLPVLCLSIETEKSIDLSNQWPEFPSRWIQRDRYRLMIRTPKRGSYKAITVFGCSIVLIFIVGSTAFSK